ncbi:MAG: hypothetical protein ACREGG_02260 [Candidatus Saccharimonadales bacterium]
MMSEDAPQFPPPEGEQQEHQLAPPETQDAAEELGGVAVGEEPTKIDVQDGSPTTEDTRWDEDKARTVGMAAKASDMLHGEDRLINEPLENLPLDSRAFDNERLNREREAMRELNESPEALEREVRNRGVGGTLQWTKERIAELQAEGKEIPEDLSQQLQETQSAHDEYAERVRTNANYYVEDREREREQVIEKLTSPFEELYDLNPELFAQMPTPEFIEVYKEQRDIDEKIGRREKCLGELVEAETALKAMLENRELITWDDKDPDRPQDIYHSIPPDLRDIIYGVSGGIREDYTDDKIVEVLRKYESEFRDNNFGKSPQQIMEGYIRLTNEYLDQIRSLLAETESRKKEFMAKYQKSSEETPPVESTT